VSDADAPRAAASVLEIEDRTEGCIGTVREYMREWINVVQMAFEKG
jgi:hypothetical protein